MSPMDQYKVSHRLRANVFLWYLSNPIDGCKNSVISGFMTEWSMPWCIRVSPRSLRNVCAARMAWRAASFSIQRDIKREEHERNNVSVRSTIIANMGDRSERGSAKHRRRTTISGDAAAHAKRSGATETLSGQVKEKEPRHDTSASKQKNHSDAGDDTFR